MSVPDNARMGQRSGMSLGLVGAQTDELRVAERSIPQNTSTDNASRGGRLGMAVWEKQIGAINLIVGDLKRSKAFYVEAFGLAPQHEDEDTVMFRFKDTYVFLQSAPGHQDGPSGETHTLAQNGVGQFVIIVQDVDAVRAELDQRGVTVISGPADRDWGMRTMTFADPGGYTWEIAQDLPSAPSP
jgi:lactoylglutathione lyase